MRLVLLGPPAAGKGTQGKLLSERFHIPHISTGSMFRASMRSESTVGIQARQYIEKGELVPDAVAIEVVKERLSQPDARLGFVLDGFPRTVPQAVNLDKALHELSMGLDATVDIHIPEEETISRIAQRRLCGQCGSTTRADVAGNVCPDCGGQLIQRPDDTLETARNRLLVYLAQTQPVVDYYMNNGRLITVDGMQPVEEVFKCISSALVSMTSAPLQTGQDEVAK